MDYFNRCQEAPPMSSWPQVTTEPSVRIAAKALSEAWSDFTWAAKDLLLDVAWCWLMLLDVGWCWLMLVDVAWCWLILVDVGWCCLMLLDVGWCWLFPWLFPWSSFDSKKKSIWTMKDSVIRVEMVWAWVCKLCMVTWFLNSHAWNSSMVPEWPSTEPKLCANKAESHASVVVGRHLRSTKLAATSGFYLIVGSEDSQGEKPFGDWAASFSFLLMVAYTICHKVL